MAEKIGVYICHCGSNIAGTVDVAEVARWAASLRDVAVSRDYKFMCSSLGQQMIEEDIKQQGLTRAGGGGLFAAPAREDPTGPFAMASTMSLVKASIFFSRASLSFTYSAASILSSDQKLLNFFHYFRMRQNHNRLGLCFADLFSKFHLALYQFAQKRLGKFYAFHNFSLP